MAKELKGLPLAFVQWMKLLAPHLPLPVHEHRFHQVRRWRLDLAWLADDMTPLVAVECHGGVFRGGRHTRGEGFTLDREKMNEALLHGFLVLEFTSTQINDDPDYCIDQLERAMKMKGMIDG